MLIGAGCSSDGQAVAVDLSEKTQDYVGFVPAIWTDCKGLAMAEVARSVRIHVGGILANSYLRR
jgi:hypothetical protein